MFKNGIYIYLTGQNKTKILCAILWADSKNGNEDKWYTPGNTPLKEIPYKAQESN